MCMSITIHYTLYTDHADAAPSIIAQRASNLTHTQHAAVMTLPEYPPTTALRRADWNRQWYGAQHQTVQPNAG